MQGLHLITPNGAKTLVKADGTKERLCSRCSRYLPLTTEFWREGDIAVRVYVCLGCKQRGKPPPKDTTGGRNRIEPYIYTKITDQHRKNGQVVSCYECRAECRNDETEAWTEVSKGVWRCDACVYREMDYPWLYQATKTG